MHLILGKNISRVLYLIYFFDKQKILFEGVQKVLQPIYKESWLKLSIIAKKLSTFYEGLQSSALSCARKLDKNTIPHTKQTYMEQALPI
jgi:hypothetical protein